MKKYFQRAIFLVLVFSFTLFSVNVCAAGKETKPPLPVLSQNIKVPTEGNVIVTIANWGNAVTKEYKINNGAWQKYASPITLKENATVYARGKNASGITSDIGSLKVSNIRKLLSKTEVSKLSASTVEVIFFDINDNPVGNGSGFIVSSDGLVVTNYHVIDMAPKIRVVTSDNKIYDVLGVTAYDVNHDLAVLKLFNAQNLPAVKLGNSDDLKLGEDVVAIGYPLGLKVTVSFGNVSSLNAPGGLLRTSQKDIQITAPISSGSSGGPLLNMYGEVVGINYSTIVDAQNINYSIPVNEIKPMLAWNKITKLFDVIKEVYPTMDISDYEYYLYFNYPDKISGQYLFSFSDIYIDEPKNSPNELDVYLSLNNLKYGQILLAEFEGNKQKVEEWLGEIYSNIKAKYPDKTVYVIAALDYSFNTRPEGYTDDEAAFNNETKMWEVFRIKVAYKQENNVPMSKWY